MRVLGGVMGCFGWNDGVFMGVMKVLGGMMGCLG